MNKPFVNRLFVYGTGHSSSNPNVSVPQHSALGYRFGLTLLPTGTDVGELVKRLAGDNVLYGVLNVTGNRFRDMTAYGISTRLWPMVGMIQYQ